jgi:hypothetical protein
VFGAISRWFDARRKRREAVASAVRHFEANGGNDPLPGISCVIGEDAGDFIVRVCHGGDIIPPGRVWYRVGSNFAVLAELSFADVTRFGERYWR